MTKQYVLRSALGSVLIFVNLTSARVELMLMLADCTVFPANAAPVGLKDTNSSMTSLGEHLSELISVQPRSLPVLFEGMEIIQMASHCCHGKVGAVLHGTLRSLTHWPPPTSRLDELFWPMQLIQQPPVDTSNTMPFRPHISSYL